VHVPDEAEIIFVPTSHADRLSPFLDSFQDLKLHSVRPRRGSFGKASDELVEEVFGGYLQVERIATVLDTYIQQLDRVD